MSENQSIGPATPKVAFVVYTSLLWTGTAISLALIVFRCWVRVRSFGRLYVDDGFVILAWLQLSITAILWEFTRDDLAATYALAGNQIPPTPENLQKLLNFGRATVGFEFIFFICLLSIKLSFLFFFRRITEKVMGLRVLWWSVTVLTLVAFISCISIIQWRCFLSALDVQEVLCPASYRAKYFQRTLLYQSLIDVLTDIAIIAIPTVMLWNFQVSLQKKLALVGIFSLTIIVIIFAFIRLAVVKGGYNNQADTSWLFLWSSGEMALAIVVACLGSFRHLFVIQDKRPYIHPTTDSPQSTTSNTFALPRFRLSHSLKRNKSVALLPTQTTATIDPPRNSISSVPRIHPKRFESKLEQQIGTDSQLTRISTTNSLMVAYHEYVREDIAFISSSHFERNAETKEELVLGAEG